MGITAHSMAICHHLRSYNVRTSAISDSNLNLKEKVNVMRYVADGMFGLQIESPTTSLSQFGFCGPSTNCTHSYILSPMLSNVTSYIRYCEQL